MEIDVGQYSPWLGMPYRRLARLGLSMQRSQNAGRSSATPGAAVRRYQRIWPPSGPERTASSFFDGLEVGWESLAELAGSPDSAVLASRGRDIGAHVAAAAAAFSLQRPVDSVPALAAGLGGTRDLLARLAPADDAAFLLRTKAGQFERALSAALALDLLGMAVPPGAEIGVAAELGAVVPGQRLAVDLSLAGSSLARLSDVELQVETPTNWRVAPEADAHPSPDGTIVHRMLVTIGGDARLARPAFTRTSLMQHRYTGAERAMAPFAAPQAIAVARFQVDGLPVTLRSAVRRREARLPYGYIRRELQVVPALSLTLRPRVAIVPSGREGPVTLTVDVGRAGLERPGGDADAGRAARMGGTAGASQSGSDAGGGTLRLHAPPDRRDRHRRQRRRCRHRWREDVS